MQSLLNFMQTLVNTWERVRKIDPSKLSATQIVVGVTGTIIGLWALSFVLSLLVTVLNIMMPVSLAVLVGFLGYRWITSRSEDIPAEMQKSEQEKKVDEALANVQAVQRGESLDSQEKRSDAAISVQVEGEKEEEVPLVIAQIVNPETGFKEPDIQGLIEHEEQKLKEADKVNNDVLSQIQLRRQRLLGKKKDASSAAPQIVKSKKTAKKPDVGRLVENEEQKLKDANQVNDEILAEIEQQEQRLLGKDGNK